MDLIKPSVMVSATPYNFFTSDDFKQTWYKNMDIIQIGAVHEKWNTALKMNSVFAVFAVKL